MILKLLVQSGMHNFAGYLILKLVYLLLAFLILTLLRQFIALPDRQRRYQLIFGYVNIMLLTGYLFLELKWPLWVWPQLRNRLIPTLVIGDAVNLMLIAGYLLFFLYQSYRLARKTRFLAQGFGSYLLQYGYIWLFVINLLIYLRLDYFYLTTLPGNLPWYRQALIESAVTVGFVILQWLVLRLRRLKMTEAEPELRKLVLEVAGRFKVKVSAVRVWHLDGVRNAFLSGFLIPSIFITETLLRTASRADLRMIVGHECAHLKKKHLLVRVALILVLVWVGSNFIEEYTGKWIWPAGFLYILLAIFLYQYLSRRQELQADLLAAKFLDGGESMANALAGVFGTGNRYGPLTRLLIGHPDQAERIKKLKDLS